MKIIEAPLNVTYSGPNRIIHLPDGGSRQEDDNEFLLRMKEANDILWNDLERANLLVPAFGEARLNRKNLLEALEGIASGGRMKEVILSAGFAYWNDFANHIRRAPCLKRFYDMAKDERETRRLADAEDALHERAVEGVDEPMVNHLGKIVGYKKKYSDSLLALQLKSLNPDKYSDKSRNDDTGLVVSINMDMGERQEKPAGEIREEPSVGYSGLSSLIDQ